MENNEPIQVTLLSPRRQKTRCPAAAKSLRGLFWGLACLLGGCVSLPKQAELESLELPTQWTEKTVAQDTPVVAGWIDEFHDAKLKAWVDEALIHNHDLKAASYRVASISQNAVIARADRLPQLDLNLRGSRRKTVTEPASLPFLPAAQTVSATTNTFAPSFDMSWEIDLWGRLLNAESAANLDSEAAARDYAAARLSLAANVARAWFQAIAANQQWELAQQTAHNFSIARDQIESRYHAGTGDALDLRLARANAANAEAQIPLRHQQRTAAMRTLERLLGRYPEKEWELSADLPPMLSPVPTGVPSDLLERRPDLAAARSALNAAYERAHSARKLALPAIRLTGSSGTSSQELGNVLDGDFSVWSVAAGIVQPIFNAGRIRANAERAKLTWYAEWENYRSALVTALSEVETALAGEADWTDRVTALERVSEESTDAEIMAWERYEKGIADIVTLLEAQRRAFTAKAELIEAKQRRLQNRIDLHLALGGDFTQGN